MSMQGGKPTWAGWSRECVQDWWPFIKIAIPSELAQLSHKSSTPSEYLAYLMCQPHMLNLSSLLSQLTFVLHRTEVLAKGTTSLLDSSPKLHCFEPNLPSNIELMSNPFGLRSYEIGSSTCAHQQAHQQAVVNEMAYEIDKVTVLLFMLTKHLIACRLAIAMYCI